jgi:RimJ/RimL family protein N-acetyltransferase
MSPIETPRLLLRQWRDSDLEPWAEMSADLRVMEFLGAPLDADRAIAIGKNLAERHARDGYGWWVAEVKDGAPFAGLIALQDVPFDAHFTPAIEVGWRLAAPYWGNGYATEGAAAAIAFAFNELDRGEVVAMTAKLNLRSQHVMQRLGMTYDPADDFEHPRVAEGSLLRPHVLSRFYRP